MDTLKDFTYARDIAALLYRLKEHAMRQCKEQAAAYAQCCGARVFSAVWACRQDFRELNECLQKQ